MKKFIPIIIILFACDTDSKRSDAYGNFETTETTIAAEGAGKILTLKLEEGQQIKKGVTIGTIDTSQLHYQKKVLVAKRQVIASRTGNISTQRDVFRKQLAQVSKEIKRFSQLVADKAATQKQLDDLTAKATIINSQIKNIESQHQPIFNEIKVLDAQIDQLNDLIKKRTIKNPIDGTVTTKLAQQGEMINIGQPMYKIANLSTMTLRAYVSGAQLPHIKLGQKVSVLIDNDEQTNTTLSGTIQWISDVAAFTPKIIQTKEERVSLIYEVKVIVKNDGTLKMGMPGEVKFDK